MFWWNLTLKKRKYRKFMRNALMHLPIMIRLYRTGS